MPSKFGIQFTFLKGSSVSSPEESGRITTGEILVEITKQRSQPADENAKC